MTRVNIIAPSELYDQHLMAEFREIQHVGPALQRSLNRKTTPFDKKEIPKKYTLNKGHVTFFYDKGLYLCNRFNKIRLELIRRGFNINTKTQFNIANFPEDGFRNDWTPTEEEIQINVERIMKRLNEKKDFYTKREYIV